MTRMPFRLISSQGRIADRTPNAISGARLTIQALARCLGADPVMIGTPSPSATDDWRISLLEAAQTLEGLQAAVSEALSDGMVPLLAKNTCSASLATLPVAIRSIPNLKVLWVDAHGDFNTPKTTASGYLGGMVLAAVCGLWDSGYGSELDPRQVLIAGIRDIDTDDASPWMRPGPRSLNRRWLRLKQSCPLSAIARSGSISTGTP